MENVSEMENRMLATAPQHLTVTWVFARMTAVVVVGVHGALRGEGKKSRNVLGLCISLVSEFERIIYYRFITPGGVGAILLDLILHAETCSKINVFSLRK